MCKEINKKHLSFIIGLPDNKQITVSGYNNAGKMTYDWSGNADFHNYINIANTTRNYMSIIWHADPKRTVKSPNIMINCISDPDTCQKSLKRAVDIINGVTQHAPHIALFNDPRNLHKTKRETIYQQYHTLPNIILPKVIRIAPLSAIEVLNAAKENQIAYPFLVRPCGSHQSEGLIRIDHDTDIKKLHAHAYDGRDYYITQFIDNKHEDGLYKKARLVMIDGVIYPRHYISYPKWLVEGMAHFYYMPSNPQSKEIEENFLRNYRSMIDAQALKSLQTIYEDIGLDYLGFDVDIMPNGSLLIFEINVAQNAFLNVDMQNFAYMKDSADAIMSALHRSIEKKIA